MTRDAAEEQRLEIGRATVADLVARFEANRPYYLSNQFDETSTRTTFIDRFLEALGWDPYDSAGKGPFADVIRERSLYGQVAGVAVLLRPDYTLRVGGQPQACVEAKRPSSELDSPIAIFQVKNYAWNQGLTVCVLTNFAQLRVFATTGQPQADEPSVGEIGQLHLDAGQYVDAFDHIWDLLSYDATRRGDLARQALELMGPPAAQRVDRHFLSDLEAWRRAIAESLAASTTLPGWELTDIAQRALDRLVFTRVCEDRHIEPTPVLRPLMTAHDLRSDLEHVYQRLNVEYNGSIFKPHASDTTPIDDEVLRKVLAGLYPPLSPYRFDVISVEILGTIYERFLGSEVVRAGAGSIRVENRPEVRKSGGVYYTPEWVVQEIVHLAIDPLVAGKPPAELARLRVLDPACGSGSFLLGAFARIVHEYESYYTAHPTIHSRDHYLSANGRERLTERKKAQVLVENIYGIDVDPQAVGVTMLSLYLKALEGENAESLHNQAPVQTTLMRASLLPPLDRNIVCGNTLVSTDSFQMELNGIEDDEQRRLNPFDWLDPQYRFAEVLKAGGFDAVIGNPPYYSVDAVYGKRHPLLAYLRRNYPEVWQDKSDILFYFLAKALSLSAGYVTFIVSRAFLEAYKARRLRTFLSSNATCTDIIDFRGFRVFSDAAISTAIVKFDRQLTHSAVATRVSRLTQGEHSSQSVIAALRDGTAPFETFTSAQVLGPSSWNLAPSREANLQALIDADWPRLGDSIALVGQGMQTGENAVFELKSSAVDRLSVPAQLLKKRARNSSIVRFGIQPADEWLLYLEDVISYQLLPQAVRSYLEAHRDRLQGRAACQRGDCDWWRYTWPLHRDAYNQPRLVCPYRAPYGRYALDTDFEVLTLTDTTVVFLRPSRKESPLYWLGLLNSRTLSYRARGLAKLTGREMYEFFWNTVAQLPMRTIDFDSPADVARHDRVVGLVGGLLDDTRDLLNSISPGTREQLRRRRRAADIDLESVVLDLYGISNQDDQAQIVALFDSDVR